MKKYRIPALLLSLVLMLNLLVLPAAAIEEPELQCTHAILVDANYGEVLYDKKADEKAYPASITKVMTALLVLEAIDSGKLTKDQQITAGPTTLQDMSGNYSTANLEPGDVLTVEQLLYCLLLPSANEAGNILAVAVDGSIEAFVEHMNDVVHQLREVPGTRIHLTFSTDTLCSCCPNKLGEDLCDTQEKVKRYDRKTVEYFGLEEKDYVYQDLIRAMDAKATPEMLADICRDCCWFPVSACCKNICSGKYVK